MKRPQKAPSKSITDEQLLALPYDRGVYGSPKLDGIRCVIDGIPKTSSMKPQPNPFVREELSWAELNGLDGELAIGLPNDPDVFNNSTGPLRRHYGEPDFHFFVFDDFSYLDWDYEKRWIQRNNLALFGHPRIIILNQYKLTSPEMVLAYEQACIKGGYEGAMIRTASGMYKQGRATFNEMNIFKRKTFEDTEGVIVGFNEQMTNLNEAFIDEQGLTKRATNQENKVGADTLGTFIVKAKEWEAPFKVGGGELDHEERKAIWDNRKDFLGKTITFKYQPYGSIDAPRSPIFRRFYQPF